MAFTRIALLSTALLTLTACGKAQSTEQKIDKSLPSWCISGGPIYTAIDTAPKASVVAVRHGKITYVGYEKTPKNWCRKNAGVRAKKIKLRGDAMYPGFTDGHGHLLGIGLREMTLNLEGTASIDELVQRLKTVVKDTPQGETIYGRGWIETHWPEGRFPTRQDLDAVSPNHPVILERADGHAIVVNSKAIQMAGISRSTKIPFGGDILKDDKGELSGMLIDNAGELVSELISELTPKQRKAAYIKGAEIYASRGWTNIHSMSVNPADVPMIEQLASDGKIKIRVYNSIDYLSGNSASIDPDDPGDDSKRVITRAIKMYSDGALGSRGAALLAPYSDDGENTGLMTLKKDQAISIFTSALRNGTQVNTHAIGDRANKTILDWYAEAFAAVPPEQRVIAEPRWRIEHSQILDIADIPRFAAMGVIPSMQPSHAIGDLHFAVDRLGEGRLAGGYAWRSLIDSGSIIVGGTDAPVEAGDPRIEFYAATRRKDLKGFSGPGWNPEQRVTAQEALKMFTAWPAYASYQEKKIGTIEVGKWADFTIFEDDIMAADGKTILNTETRMTIVGGKVAYKR